MQFEQILFDVNGKKNLSIDSIPMNLIHGYVERYVWIFNNIEKYRINEFNELIKDELITDDEAYSDLRLELRLDLLFFKSMNKNLMNSLFTTSYNMFIMQLIKACQTFERQFELDAFKDFKNGENDFDRAHRYLKNVCKINEAGLKPLKDASKVFSKVRNVITHGLDNSSYPIKESLKKKILADNRITIEDDTFQINDIRYITDFVNLCIEYIDAVGFQFEYKKSLLHQQLQKDKDIE